MLSVRGYTRTHAEGKAVPTLLHKIATKDSSASEPTKTLKYAVKDENALRAKKDYQSTKEGHQ
jgi:hypothetical protein